MPLGKIFEFDIFLLFRFYNICCTCLNKKIRCYVLRHATFRFYPVLPFYLSRSWLQVDRRMNRYGICARKIFTVIQYWPWHLLVAYYRTCSYCKHKTDFPFPLQGMRSINSDRVALCAGCGGKISDRYYLLAVDKQWHMRCLKCCECKLNLESELTCFSKDGSIYCKEDYYR